MAVSPQLNPAASIREAIRANEVIEFVGQIDVTAWQGGAPS